MKNVGMQKEEREIARLISRMEYPPVPPGLTRSVMDRINPARQSPWTRLKTWLMTPRPLRIAPVWQIAGTMALVSLFIITARPALFGTAIQTGPPPPGGTEEETPVVHVMFRLNVAQAHEVALIGSFNNWKSDGYKMQKLPGGTTWTISLPLPRGRYEYAFIVDNKHLVADPESLIQKDDGFGNINSVCIVENHEQTVRHPI